MTVHRKWPREESSYILNFVLLAVVTSYILHEGNSQNTQVAVVNILAGIVFITFIVALGFQAYEKLATSVLSLIDLVQHCLSVQMSGSLQETIANWTDEPNPELGPEQDSNMRELLLPLPIHFDKYHEPVLEYKDENT